MGDRYFAPRHPNLTLLLQRQPARPLAGIGHNGGPPLDMSFTGWAWRRAATAAWAAPPREVALQRLKRAERLGLGYRDYTAALMDTGTHLSAALLPLHYLLGGAALRADPQIAACITRFNGRLLLLADEAAFGPLDAAARRLLKQRIALLAPAATLVVLPFRIDEGDAARGRRLRRLLARQGLHPHACFLLGSTMADMQLARDAGLALFRPLAGWFMAG